MRIVNLHHTAFVATFRKLGHEVLSIGTTPDCDVTLQETLSCRRFLDLLAGRGMSPELVFWCDSCQIPWVFGLENLPAVTIGYSVDQYMNPWHVPYSACFDALFVAQKDYLPLFAASPTNRPASWMPLFCNPVHDRDDGFERDIPVSFIGTQDSPVNPGRKPFLNAFRRMAPLFSGTGSYPSIFGRSQIVLNQSAAGELNFRVFQAMACGAALLTEDTENGLRDLFVPGRDLLVYKRGDPADAARAARAALNDPDLSVIAKNGRRKTLANHTVASRARDILATAASLGVARIPQKRLAAQAQVAEQVRKAYAILATDENLPLSTSDRQFFMDMARRG